MKIKLNTIKNANDFVNVCSRYNVTDIKVKQGERIIDAKSILGILSLNLLESLDVIFDIENDSVKINFYNDIHKWETSNSV